MLHIFDTQQEVLKGLADFFIISANEAIQKRGIFNVALSGGSSPKALHELLVSSYNDKTDWTKMYFFVGDERYVPSTHQDSNFLMAKNTLFDPLGIAENQTFRVKTELSQSEAAKDYADQISSHFKTEPVHFDLILLGLGDDSHTASLFPGTTVLQEKASTVQDVFLEKLQVYRITMTAPLINQAHAIAFLVFGKGKAEAIKRVLKDERNTNLYPAQLIKQEANWFLDHDAAALVK